MCLLIILFSVYIFFLFLFSFPYQKPFFSYVLHIQPNECHSYTFPFIPNFMHRVFIASATTMLTTIAATAQRMAMANGNLVSFFCCCLLPAFLAACCSLLAAFCLLPFIIMTGSFFGPCCCRINFAAS